MRRAFQITLLLAAFIPFLLGAMSLVQGAGRMVPEDLITAKLDGQIRFWGVRSMLPFLLTIWIVANLEKAYAVLVIVLAATAAGGLARVAAVLVHGAPEPALMGIIAFEIGALLLIPWYVRVVRPTKTRAPA